jgi:hypothetical protein
LREEGDGFLLACREAGWMCEAVGNAIRDEGGGSIPTAGFGEGTG